MTENTWKVELRETWIVFSQSDINISFVSVYYGAFKLSYIISEPHNVTDSSTVGRSVGAFNEEHAVVCIPYKFGQDNKALVQIPLSWF